MDCSLVGGDLTVLWLVESGLSFSWLKVAVPLVGEEWTVLLVGGE